MRASLFLTLILADIVCANQAVEWPSGILSLLAEAALRSDEEVDTQQIHVIGAGLGRTGTASLKVALGKLGYKTYHMKELLENNHAWAWNAYADTGNAAALIEVIGKAKQATMPQLIFLHVYCTKSYSLPIQMPKSSCLCETRLRLGPSLHLTRYGGTSAHLVQCLAAHRTSTSRCSAAWRDWTLG